MKVDFHIHTNFSHDGWSSPKEVVRAAIEKKLDAICITDHGEIRGAIEAMKYAFDKNLLVLPGIEISTKSGDILGINVKKIIPDGLSVKETIHEIHKQKAMAIVAHPFKWPLFNFKDGINKFLLSDGLEAFNAMVFSFLNKKALDFSKKYNLPFTAGSDAHRAEFVGRGYLEIPKDNLSEKEILEEIKKKSGEIKGKILNFRETLKNFSRVGLRGLITHRYHLKKKKT